MRRHLIGIIALVLLLGAAVFAIRPPQGAAGEQFNAACWRVGALMAVLWLAYDQLRRLPTWLFGVLVSAALIVAIRPKAALIAIPIIVVLAILRPRFGRRE